MTVRSSRARVIALLVVATAVGVVLCVIGGVLLLQDSAKGGGDDNDRNEVTSRATDFAVAYNTYDVARLDEYQKRVKGLLTPAYSKQFVEVTDAIFKALETKKQTSDGANVLGVAIDSIDKDSAEAIIAVDAKISNTDNEAAVLRHFRWKVSFTKTKSKWLVAKFECGTGGRAGHTRAVDDDPQPPGW